MIDNVLKEEESRVNSVTLIPSDGGKFEVSVNNELVFSKLSLGRHANEGEILDLIKKNYLSE